MDAKRQTHLTNDYTDRRLQQAQAGLRSAVADAAAQGTLAEPVSARLTKMESEVPKDDLDCEVITAQAEKLSRAMSYLNDLHANRQVETEMVRMVYACEQPDLICAVVDAARRDFALIEHRLEESVKAGVIDEARRAEILSNPFLNQQAADALDAFTKTRALKGPSAT
ncbi:MAG: hypothetical protein K2Y37_01315 [Pirellulales bacterium]|nr:hypothetical protein [Pirellulales bacterium]